MTAAPAPDTLIALDPAAQALLFRGAHTAHAFTDDPVTDQQMRAIHDLIKYAPTSLNSQPLRGILVRSSQARQRLVTHMAAPNQAKTATAPLSAILAADLDFHDHLPRLLPQLPGARDLYADPDRRNHTALVNTSLQIAYLILGIRAAGLAAGPMAGFDTEAVTKEFFPDGHHQALVVVNIGTPAPDAYRPRNPRLDYHETFTTI